MKRREKGKGNEVEGGREGRGKANVSGRKRDDRNMKGNGRGGIGLWNTRVCDVGGGEVGVEREWDGEGRRGKKGERGV